MTRTATTSQIDYILSLIDYGTCSGNPAPTGPTTAEGIAALTISEASAYIDAWKTAQGPNIEAAAAREAEIEAARAESAAFAEKVSNGEITVGGSLRERKNSRKACEPGCTRVHKHR